MQLSKRRCDVVELRPAKSQLSCAIEPGLVNEPSMARITKSSPDKLKHGPGRQVIGLNLYDRLKQPCGLLRNPGSEVELTAG